MDYKEYIPTSRTSHLVKCFWTLKGRDDDFHEVVPDGCMDIIFNFSSPLINRNDNSDIVNTATVFVVGNLTRPLYSGSTGHYDLLGIRFHAGAMYDILQQPLSEFTDLTINLRDVAQALNGPDMENLYMLGTIRRIQFLENWLAQYTFKIDPRVSEALALGEKTSGLMKVHQLSDAVCLSNKQLRRLFLNYVGISPKFYLDNIRFSILENTLHHPIPRWEMAEDLGFYDHAHLHKFYARFTNKRLAG